MKYDVIIAGAGPVGLFLATELAQAACSVLILERAESPHSPLKQLPFGMRGLSAPTVEAFERRGLLQELEVHRRVKNPHQHAGQGARRQLGHFAGIPFHEGDVAIAQCNLISEMAELESVLGRRATALGVEIRRGLSLTSFAQTGEGVGVRAGEQSFEGQWLVGCDGARSVVRKLGGFEFAGTAPEFTGYTLQVDIADPHKLNSGRTMTAAGMYLQSQPGYLIVQDFDGGAFHQSRAAVTLEHAQQLVRRVAESDVTLTALHLASTWTDQARQVSSYRNGRILLAGDAAHVHPPIGGQGLNLGVQDAVNLGWKLAQVVKGTSPDSLLDTYHAERHPVAARVLRHTMANVALRRTDDRTKALDETLAELFAMDEPRKRLVADMSGLGIRYGLGEGHPLLRRRMPDLDLVTAEGPLRVFALLHAARPVLLNLGEPGGFDIAPWADRVRQVDGRYEGAWELPAIGEVAAPAAVLIRPDGHVAWVGDSAQQGLAEALATWFGPPSAG